MRVITLVDDIAGRWHKGEVGQLLENDYEEKYAYKVQFQGKEDTLFGPMPRVYYFYKHEVEVQNED